MTLTVVLPTRGRPNLLLQTVEKIAGNMQLPDTTLAILVDEDDKQTRWGLKLSNIERDPRIKVSVAPREDTKGGKHDRVLSFAPATLYMPVADYAPILTPGFDRLMLEAYARFPDGLGFVYTNMANASFPLFIGIPQKIVDRLGYLFPGWFPFWFCDHWICDLARMIDRISFADVTADHTSMKPPHTIGLRDLKFWATFFDAGAVQRRREAAALIAEMDEPEWRKQILLTHNPLIEFYSRYVNGIVRAEAGNWEKNRTHDSAPDERYQRVKSAAEKQLLLWFEDLEQQEKLAA